LSDYKLIYKLKQHTPIVHFQSDQSGATLRATELKPKLDKFLLANIKDLPIVNHANGAKSLDYKVSIRANGVVIKDIETFDNRGKEQKDPLFFGNMGDGIRKRFAEAGNIEIEFITFNVAIKQAIDSKFESFLAQTNFGTRQSKGFGSFYLDKAFDKTLIPHKVYSFKSSSWKNDIKLFYSFLRQGINLPNSEGTRFYSKPAIFSFALSKNITWDKKAIKQHFFSDVLNTQQAKYAQNSPVNFSGQNSFLMRDLFGLSSSQSWLSYKTTVEKEHQEIDRFKSPITFKIVDGNVYFWADKSIEKMLNNTFTIAIKGKKPLSLATPKEFSFDEFFDFAFLIDLSKHIDPKFHTQNEYSTLTRILKDVKASK
jgi:hypothetical protein